MVDDEIDEVVKETIKLIKEDCKKNKKMKVYFLERKEYMKLLIKGEITNTQRRIHDVIEEYQLTDNKGFMQEIVRKTGEMIKFASKRLKDDKEIMLEALRQEGNLLKYASEELKGDKEIVIEAVRQNGEALKYAGEEMKNDEEIILQAQRTKILDEIKSGDIYYALISVKNGGTIKK